MLPLTTNSCPASSTTVRATLTECAVGLFFGIEIRHLFSKQHNPLISKIKTCLGLAQEWMAQQGFVTSYISNQEEDAHLTVVDLDRDVSFAEHGYVTRPNTDQSLYDG